MKNEYNRNTFNDVKDFQQTISNISSNRISVKRKVIISCLIHFPGRIAIPNDLNGLSAHWFFAILISTRAMVMQPKSVFTKLTSLFLLFFRSKRKQNQKLQKEISCYFAFSKCVMLRSNDFGLAAECDVSFRLSGQARYHDNKVDTQTEVTEIINFCASWKAWFDVFR
jgi:hypothetical protein